MNLDLYSKLADQLNSGKKRVNMSKTTNNWAKITEAKQVFRFLPSPDGLPFKFVSRHYLSKNNSVWCPKESRDFMPGLDSYTCPICEFSWKIYNDAKEYLKGRPIKEITDEEYALDPKLKEAVEQLEIAKSISAKQQVFANVIIRGSESEGVKTVNLTGPTFKKILNIMQETLEEENKDVCDPDVGSDFKIFKVNNGKTFGEIEVLWVGAKPLSKDKAQVDAWLKDVRVDPILKEDFPTQSQLEGALVKKFNFKESEVEQLSTEKRIVGDSSDEEEQEAEIDSLDLEDLAKSIENL